jgi:hypothetical protein
MDLFSAHRRHEPFHGITPSCADSLPDSRACVSPRGRKFRMKSTIEVVFEMELK